MELKVQLKPFLDEKGRLIAFPAKRKKKQLALFYLAEKIPPDLCYDEKEVNALLNAWHTFGDPATLRRELYDYRFLDRSADGREYRKSANPPSLKEFGLE